METITTRKYITDNTVAYETTQYYMNKGEEVIRGMIKSSLVSQEKAREVFELLFSEIVSDLYLSRFWVTFVKLSDKERKRLINMIVEEYCQMGHIMGYCGTVLGAVTKLEAMMGTTG